MSVSPTDLVAYQSLNMPEDDSATSGGGINYATNSGIVVFTDVASSIAATAISDNAGDTMSLTITGRNDGGEIVSQAQNLQGISRVTFNSFTGGAGGSTIERFLKAELASNQAGTVLITRNDGATWTPIATLAPTPVPMVSVRRMFYDSSSGPAPITRYEKFFFRNNNATFALTNATIELTADPDSAVRFAMETTQNGTESVADRLTAPSNIGTWFDTGATHAITGTNLAAGAALGVWVEMVRGADDNALKSTFTLEIKGSST